MTGDPGIQTSLVRAIHNGIQVLAQVNGLALDIYLIVEDVDFDRIPDILPNARFEQDGQIHVSSLGLEDEPVEDEMESILANMDSDDTVLFFCADADAYETALDFINYTGDRSFLPIS
ncbi:hypothetical protein [Advenella kashmirensis]|uniref:hypothetical protein n=1 Tax=Advenella kashmirensis TaxID=310575 RepID=UPI0009D947A7|nr:hypothetical protein [Advenella kashmirensis]